jgi:uncharacterized protein with HEPN domain
MIDAAETACLFMRGKSRAHLANDRMMLFAVIRAIEILGEATSQVSEESRQRTPDIPWRMITSMRNRLIHGYSDVNEEIVWQTATQEIPDPMMRLNRLVE